MIRTNLQTYLAFQTETFATTTVYRSKKVTSCLWIEWKPWKYTKKPHLQIISGGVKLTQKVVKSTAFHRWKV